jgi:hypothetical protein
VGDCRSRGHTASRSLCLPLITQQVSDGISVYKQLYLPCRKSDLSFPTQGQAEKRQRTRPEALSRVAIRAGQLVHFAQQAFDFGDELAGFFEERAVLTVGRRRHLAELLANFADLGFQCL